MAIKIFDHDVEMNAKHFLSTNKVIAEFSN